MTRDASEYRRNLFTSGTTGESKGVVHSQNAHSDGSVVDSMEVRVDTGDLVRDDGRGGIRVCGRVKDIVIHAGINVPVTDVEGMLFWPERLEVMDALPRTATGKIRKAELRERLRGT